VYLIVATAAGDLSLRAALRAGLGAGALGAGLWHFVPETASAFYGRASESGDAAWRLLAPLIEPFELLGEAGAAGFGIGAAHQSAAFLVGSRYSWWTNGIVVEAETSRVMLELGILGFVLVFLFRILIALWALRAALRLRARPARSLALFLALYLALQVFSAVIFNPTANFLYWFSVGLLFAIVRLDARAAPAVRPALAVLGGLRFSRST
jgi:hypothetical protein